MVAFQSRREYFGGKPPLDINAKSAFKVARTGPRRKTNFRCVVITLKIVCAINTALINVNARHTERANQIFFYDASNI